MGLIGYLSFLFATLSAHASAHGNQFGLVGPQNLMLFLNGFHFISGEPGHYLQANHHCAIMREDFIQCAIYVPGTNPARLAGVEYIISGDAFSKLPMEERQLWHSHQFEVTSGFLVQPGMPGPVDDEVMKILVNSYGKVGFWSVRKQSQKLTCSDLPHLALGSKRERPTAWNSRNSQRLYGTWSAASGICRKTR